MPAPRPLTPEDVLSFPVIDDAQIAPDGSRVAFVRGDSFKHDTRWPKATIWLVDADGGTPRQLTTGPRTDTLPRWSPDGRGLAFLSDRLKEGQRQVFLLSLDGGEATALTDIRGAIPTPRGLNALQWSPDGRSLAFLMEDPETDADKKRKDTKDDAIAFEQQPRFVRVWVVDVATRAVRCVSPDNLQIWEFAWRPDGGGLAVVASDLPYEWAWYTNRIATFDFEGPPRTVWQSRRQVALPTWSPDGKRIGFISSNWSDRNCVAGDAFVVDADGDNARDVTEGIEASIGWLAWSDDRRELLAIAHERGGVGMHRIRVSDSTRTGLWWQQACVAEAFWPRFSRARNGRVAVALETPETPRDIWIGDLAADSIAWRQLTHLHPRAAELSIGETVVHHWQGADGWPMQGLLIRPVGYQPGRRYPLVMWVHGGPTGVSASRYYAAGGWNQLLANEGCAVFLPNYRGSVGWGLKFAESNLGDMGGRDWQDMQLGVDSLVAAGVADADRLAVAGWSYGGYATAWAVTQTDRFRAAVMGAGISHWLSFHGRSGLADWDAIHYQASPYERGGTYERFSPLTHIDRARTPTLILHGQDDEDVPVEQSHLFYRALRDKGVPVELIVYPREAHAVVERAHQLDMARRVLAWMRRYLLDDGDSPSQEGAR
jgi:dipeptidyl aminopeptidase/acylaminoacyl peptidase